MSSHDHALPGATEFRAMFFRLLALANYYGVSMNLESLGIETGMPE